VFRTLPATKSTAILVCIASQNWWCALLWIGPFIAVAYPAAHPQTTHVEQCLELLRSGDLVLAEKEARLALSEPTSRAVAMAALGAIRLQQRKYDESVVFLQQAIQLEPRLVGARLNLGQVYLLEGKRDLARGALEDVLSLDSSNYEARSILARLQAEERAYKASLEIAQPILARLRQSPEGLVMLANDYLGEQNSKAARALVADWASLQDATPDSSLEFALALMKGNLTDDAIEVLEGAKRTYPASFELAFNLAGGYWIKGDASKASDNYRTALDLNENCVLCYLQLAKIATQQGKSEKALSYLIKAREKEPENPSVLFEFGKVCLQRDLFEDAVRALQKAVELEPSRDAYAYVLASAYVGERRCKDARMLLEPMLKKRPDDPVLNYALGAVWYEESELDDSEVYLKKSIQIQPVQIASYYYLGLVADKKGETGRAIQLFQQVVRDHPSHAPSYAALGAALLKEKKYAEAQQALQKAVELDPNSVVAHYQFSMLLGRLGRKDEADKELQVFQRLRERERSQSVMQLYLLTPQ
jgi:tetratricopeptide (TPR) repeat protein